MTINKVVFISFLLFLGSRGFLSAQESVSNKSVSKEELETRKEKYLKGLKRLTDEKSVVYADSITYAQGIESSSITFLSADLEKMHPVIFSQQIDESNFKKVADRYVNENSIVKVQVMRDATNEEYNRNLEAFRVIVNEVTPQTIERDKIIADQLNKPAPYFSVTDVDGIKYDLAELKGKVVVLNFWFIGCAPCKREMPELNQFVVKYKNKDVVFLAFEVNHNDAGKVKAVARDFDYTHIPSTRKEGDVANVYQIKTYPTSYVIDQKGVIRFGLAGYNPFKLAELDSTIERLLNK